MRKSHSDRFDERQRMAQAVRAGSTLGKVARDFRVSSETVRRACIENDVDWNASNIASERIAHGKEKISAA